MRVLVHQCARLSINRSVQGTGPGSQASHREQECHIHPYSSPFSLLSLHRRKSSLVALRRRFAKACAGCYSEGVYPSNNRCITRSHPSIHPPTHPSIHPSSFVESRSLSTMIRILLSALRSIHGPLRRRRSTWTQRAGPGKTNHNDQKRQQQQQRFIAPPHCMHKSETHRLGGLDEIVGSVCVGESAGVLRFAHRHRHCRRGMRYAPKQTPLSLSLSQSAGNGNGNDEYARQIHTHI